MTVDPTDLDQLVAAVAGAVDEGVTVSGRASDITPPGVMVQVQGWTPNTLDGGYELDGRLLLAVPDTEPTEARLALLALYNQVITAVPPAGRVTAQTVVLPDTPAPLPGLAIPFAVQCTPVPEETP